MRFIVKYIEAVATMPDNFTDARNAASVELARSLVKANRDGFINFGLPLV
jgi:hypothetical protein